MPIKPFLFLVFSVFFASTISAQCPNLGFEDSSFVGWEGFEGIYRDSVTGGAGPNPVFQLNPGFSGSEHVIMSGLEYDPYSDSNITTVAPGSEFSVRLGNDSGAHNAEALQYRLSITEENAILVYGVAVVLEDIIPGHSEAQRPGFFVTITDTLGNELDTNCGKLSYIPGVQLDGFINWSQNAGIVYRPWDFAGIDLGAFIGQDVIIDFRTRDCSYTAHFGYAYIDAACYPRSIRVDYCLGRSDSINFIAPFGFSYLWSTGDTTQSFTVDANTADTLYTCTMTSTLTGCSFVLEARPEPTFYTNFDVLETSCGEATVRTTIEINRGSIASYFWNFGDSTTLGDTSNLAQPTYTYPGPGRYPVSLVVDDGLGCATDTLVDTANIYFPPVADFIADTACQNDSTNFTNLSVISPNIESTFEWNFGDGSDIDTNFSPSYVYGSSGLDTATLIVWSDSIQCGDTLSVAVQVFPRPNVAFSHPEPDSCFPHQVNFVNLTSADSLYPVTAYAWSFGNGDSSVMANPSYVYQDAGIFDVVLWAIDANGCADSLRAIDYMIVYPIPTADFSISNTEVHVRDSEVFFTNLSNNADTYDWQFGSSVNNSVGTSADANPSYIFDRSGSYEIILTAISNFGCFDTASLSVKVIDDRSFMPNIITPNGDGINDAFTLDLDPGSVTKFSCTIYNRWGQEIFYTKSPAIDWDGSVNGEQLNSGTYFYIIDYEGFEGETFSMRGDLKLIR